MIFGIKKCIIFDCIYILLIQFFYINNNYNFKTNSIKKLKNIFFISILPLVIIILIFGKINKVNQDKSNWIKIKGEIEKVGLTLREYKSKKITSPKTYSKVFFIKLQENDTIYSWYQNDNDYESIFEELKTDDKINIFYENEYGITNTINIIRVENYMQETILSEEKHFKYHYFMLFLFSIFLIIYIFSIYIVFKKNNIKRNKTNF